MASAPTQRASATDAPADRAARRRFELPARYASGPMVPSPCMSVCVMDAATGWCKGCLRTLDEIAAWSQLDADARRAIWARLPMRFDARNRS